MAPLLVLVAATLALRVLGYLGVRAFGTWPDATRCGLVIMFLFTGATHFTEMKYDYAAMIPPPFTGSLWIIALTGMLEIVGAAGLVVPATRRAAAAGLFLLLVGVFPANVHAALNGVQFRGEPPSEMWVRTLIQLVFLVAVWWSSLRPRTDG